MSLDLDTPAARIARLARARMSLPGLREESVKIDAGGVTRGRFLLSFGRDALRPGPKARLAALAADLGLDPAPLLPHVGSVCAVHVGAEADGRAKLYLEFTAGAAPEAGLVYLAVKHDARLNRYLQERDPEALLGRAVPEGPMRQTARACLPLAGGLLRVEEEGSPRLSLDLNLADAGLTVGDLPGLEPLLAGRGDALSDLRGEKLGHFAAGTGRDGQPFATIYYGGRHDP